MHTTSSTAVAAVPNVRSIAVTPISPATIATSTSSTVPPPTVVDHISKRCVVPVDNDGDYYVGSCGSVEANYFIDNEGCECGYYGDYNRYTCSLLGADGVIVENSGEDFLSALNGSSSYCTGTFSGTGLSPNVNAPHNCSCIPPQTALYWSVSGTQSVWATLAPGASIRHSSTKLNVASSTPSRSTTSVYTSASVSQGSAAYSETPSASTSPVRNDSAMAQVSVVGKLLAVTAIMLWFVS